MAQREVCRSGARRAPRVTGIAWRVQPFSGSAARPDGVAAMHYRVAAQPGAPQRRRAPWLPARAIEGAAPPPGAALMKFEKIIRYCPI